LVREQKIPCFLRVSEEIVLKPYARELRKQMTDCERLLWSKIRRKQIQGVQFYSQKPMGTFILDFYAKHPKLCIELDGGHHFTTEQKNKDINRDAYLKTLGITVLRFTNLEVLQQIHAANANARVAIRTKIRALQKAQNNAVKTKEFSDGRIRYYTKETPSKEPGPTKSAAFVTEHNTKTGQVRTWLELYDHAGNVNRVHPKMIDGKNIVGQHYPPIETELDLFPKKPRGPK